MRFIADLLRTFGLGLLAFLGGIVMLVLLVAAIPVILTYAAFF